VNFRVRGTGKNQGVVRETAGGKGGLNFFNFKNKGKCKKKENKKVSGIFSIRVEGKLRLAPQWCAGGRGKKKQIIHNEQSPRTRLAPLSYAGYSRVKWFSGRAINVGLKLG